MLGGIVLATLAATAYETGYVLQARGARAAPAGPPSAGLAARLVREPAFVGGAMLGIGGFALQVAALHDAPLAVVQPILALGLIGLLGLAVVALGERPVARDLAGVVVVAAGAALVFAVAPASRSHPASAAPYVIAVLIAVAVAGLTLGRANGWALVAAVAAADVLVALAGARLGAGGATAAGWLVLAAAAALVAVTAESSALQRLPAVRVGPVVLAAQAVVPIVLAPVVVGDPWPDGVALAVFTAGLALLAAGVALLASSRRLADVMAAGH